MEKDDKRKREEFTRKSQSSDSLLWDPQGVVYRANTNDVARPGDGLFGLLLHCRTSDGRGGVSSAEGVHSIHGVDVACECCTVRMVNKISKWFPSSLVCGNVAKNFVGINVLPNCTMKQSGYRPCPDIDQVRGKRSAMEVNDFDHHMDDRGIFMYYNAETGESSQAEKNFFEHLNGNVKSRSNIRSGHVYPHPSTFSTPIAGVTIEHQLRRNVNHIEQVESSLQDCVAKYNEEYKEQEFRISLQGRGSLMDFCLKKDKMPFISNDVEAMKGALKGMKLDINQRAQFFVMLAVSDHGKKPLMTLLRDIEMPDNCVYWIISNKAEMKEVFGVEESQLTVRHVLQLMGKKSMALDGKTSEGKEKRAVKLGKVGGKKSIGLGGKTSEGKEKRAVEMGKNSMALDGKTSEGKEKRAVDMGNRRFQGGKILMVSL